MPLQCRHIIPLFVLRMLLTLTVVVSFATGSCQNLQTKDSMALDSSDCDLDLAWYDLLTDWHSKDITDNNAVSDIIINDSLIIARLNAIPSIIPLNYNEHVRNAVNVYVNHRRGLLSRVLTSGKHYFPIFEQRLAAYHLPLELRHLPIIESGLNGKAVSPAGAAGLWQFMVLTGRAYGLEINSLVDERCDTYKATDAACRFLRDLYAIYGDWHLAIAAYNCGPGNVNKAIARSGGKRSFWEIYDYLPRETRSYLPLFIAATYATTYAESHNITPAIADETVLSDTVMTSDRIHFQQIATALNIDIETLRQLNPQYRHDIIPGGKQYPVCLPLDRQSDFIILADSIAQLGRDSLIAQQIALSQKQADNGGTGVVRYKVKKGDTLGAIAKRYHCTVKQLQKWNHMKSTNLQIGQTLKIMK